MKQLNDRQVVRAWWLSVPHDTKLTSGVAPNQIKRQEWTQGERCHLGATEIAGVSSGSDEAVISVSSLSIRSMKPRSQSLLLWPPPPPPHTPSPLVNWLDGGDYRAPGRWLLGYWWQSQDRHGSGHFLLLFGVKVFPLDFLKDIDGCFRCISVSSFGFVKESRLLNMCISKTNNNNWLIMHKKTILSA